MDRSFISGSRAAAALERPATPPTESALRLSDYRLELLRRDQELILYRGTREGAGGTAPASILVREPASTRVALDQTVYSERALALSGELHPDWAVRPIALRSHGGRMALVLEDPGGDPLDLLLADRAAGLSDDIERFLQLAAGIASALCELHGRGLVHRDIKPANVIAVLATGRAWLTGFGLVCRQPAEGRPATAPEVLAGTLPYMSPEQTGRVDRAIDERSDLYSLGVTLYEALTGKLPFSASQPSEWIHAHLARRPVPPGERLPAGHAVPEVLSTILLKLMAKAPEDRYQTAAGLRHDLTWCLTEWRSRKRIEPFVLGEGDASQPLAFSGDVHGRDTEVARLVACFEKVASTGRPALALVAGNAGVGKSALVGELQKWMTERGELFAAGKFDQYRRDVPYGALAQAVQALARSLIGSQPERTDIRTRVCEALGENSSLLLELVPDIAPLRGSAGGSCPLSPGDERQRFLVALARFIGAFGAPGRPVILCLDDLQWADVATLRALEHLLTSPDVRNVMVIAAYRDSEVDDAHRLHNSLETIRRGTTASIVEVGLASLPEEALRALVASLLGADPSTVTELAAAVYGKTGGNPFFAIQFMRALVDDGHLRWSRPDQRWHWALDGILAETHTQNVLDLMRERLDRLGPETRIVLQHLACCGNTADVHRLAIVLDQPVHEVVGMLRDSVQLDLVFLKGSECGFVYDRVREVVYQQIPAPQRAEMHWRIGRRLAAQGPECRDRAVFDIVDQLNRGLSSVTAAEERLELAELNLLAGRRAKAAAAHAEALDYLSAGLAALPTDAWLFRRDLVFALRLEAAECELFTAAVSSAERRLEELAERASTPAEHAAVACLRLDLYYIARQTDRGVAVGIACLKKLHGQWPDQATADDVRTAYDRLWSDLGRRAIEDLVDLPPMTDPVSLAMMDVFVKLGPSAAYEDAELYSLIACAAVTLSLRHGNSDSSAMAYVRFGIIAAERFGSGDVGFRFGQVGCELVERRGLKRFAARTYLMFAGYLMPFAKPISSAREMVQRGFEVAKDGGDVVFAAAYRAILNEIVFAAGDPLAEVERGIEETRALASRGGGSVLADMIEPQLALVRALRDSSSDLRLFEGEPAEGQREHRATAGPGDQSGFGKTWHSVRRLQALYLAGDYAAAIALHPTEREISAATLPMPAKANLRLYAALARAASADVRSPELMRSLAADQNRFAMWARSCPENFGFAEALLGAEVARLEQRDAEAMRLFERAIACARASGFVQHEALASEVAGRFYLSQEVDKVARFYFEQARDGYSRWGADAKVRQLERLYGLQPVEREPEMSARCTVSAPVDQLDLATVLKVSEAVAGEIEPERLLEMLMRTAVEQAGADTGVLLLSRGSELRPEAQATTEAGELRVRVRGSGMEARVPRGVVDAVVSTHERVLINDVVGQRHAFVSDPYFRETAARSLLCVPLLKQGTLIGVLYLENTLTAHAFSPSRLSVLSVVASQAALSLENGRLYRELQNRESRIRSLVDANLIGVVILEPDGRIIEANDAFLRIVGYSREDVVAGRLHRDAITTAEMLGPSKEVLAGIFATGRPSSYEKEYIRKDGTRVPVLVGGARLSGDPEQAVGFALDLSDRRRAEEERARAHRLEIERESAVATERSRLASEIHDTLAQQLAMMVALLADVEAKLGPTWAEAGRPLATVRELAIEALSYARRSMSLLRPNIVSSGLPRALRDVVDSVRRHFSGSVTLTVSGVPTLLDAEVESALLGIGREALSNAVRHSGAVQIRVQLTFSGVSSARLVVYDNGVGFDAHAPGRDGYGLVSMRERAVGAGVLLTVATEPGAGTEIVASWSRR